MSPNTPTLFQRLSKPSTDDDVPSFLHVPLLQRALANLDPDYKLTAVEKQIRHSSIMFEYLHRRFGRDAGALNTVLLTDDLLKWLSQPAPGNYALPVTNFLWLIMHYVTPYDRLCDIKTKKGIEDFYTEVVGKYYIGMNLPSRLLPDAVFDYLAQDYPCAIPAPEPCLPLSRGLAYVWREFISEVPFAPADAQARITFFVRFLLFVQMTEIDLRLFSPQLVKYLNAPMFPSDMNDVHATGLIYEVMRLAGLGDMAGWQNKGQVTEKIRRFFGGAFASLALPKSIAEHHLAVAAQFGMPQKAVTFLTGDNKARKKYIMADEPAIPYDTSKAWVNTIETGETNATFNTITRRLVQAIQTANVPMTTLLPPYEPYASVTKSNNLITTPWGKINLFQVDLGKCADVMLSQGLPTMNGRTNIGYCTWETSKLPRAHKAGVDLLDEIWVPSEYVKNIFTDVTNKPVHVMPYPVTVVQPSPDVSRKTYGIPDDAFVFITAFDCFDLMARKNPVAAALAFQRAFPKNPNVRLLIKTRNLEKGNAPKEHATLVKLQELSQKDPRIILFHNNLLETDMTSFLNLADCYVSLHRSSAYGRTIMEAMLLGKPVIVTKGSGTADFANEQTAVLVDAVDCSIVYDAYKYLDHERGHRWLDPDPIGAADAMKRVVEDKAFAASIAKAGKAYIEANYNPEVTGARMRKRLEYLVSGELLK